LLDVFCATLAESPDRVALDAPDGVLTYTALWAMAGELAVELRRLGAGPGDRVGVRMASGTAALYASILGVLRAGAAYVPVDADDPPRRAARVWAAAGVCCVVQDGPAVVELRPPGGGDRDDPGIADDAWVIFTSGSTGEPKGVAVTHRSAAAFVDAEAGLWAVHPGDRVLAGLSVGFDASCEEMWLAWRHGAALVPAPRAIVRSGADLGGWLQRRGVSVVSTVPTLASIWPDDVLAGVRLLILGGEACGDALGWRLAAGREVWNTYGPTEATVVTTAGRILPGRPVTIGRALAGWRTAVVDDRHRPVAQGETGELVVSGVGLARYLDAALDAERFAPMPELGWERAYRTGDLVREIAGGLQYVGRADHQVKIAGRRIELGEIESLVAGCPGVRAAAAAVRHTPGGDPVLVAYFAGATDPGAVRSQVAERLPAGDVPLIAALEALPLTAAGKVDRRALPWPPPAGAARSADAISTGTESWLAELWARHAGAPAAGRESDFFEAGGTSVAAARLVSELRSRFPSAAISDVYEHPRLGRLAARLDSLTDHQTGDGAPAAAGARGWGAAQLAGVLVLVLCTLPSWLLAAFAIDDWQETGPRVPLPWLAAGWLLALSAPARVLAAAGVRRLLLGRVRAGRYPRRGWVAWRIWFVDRLGDVLHLERVAGTPWAPAAARLFGARIGAGARLGTLPSPTALIRIGPGATLEAGIDAHGWWVEGDELVVGELRVGSGARVGTRSVLMPGADIGDRAEIEPGSVVSTAVPAGERWYGSPARWVGDADSSWPSDEAPRPAHPVLWRAMYATGVLAVDLLAILAALPALGLMESLGTRSGTVHGTVVTLIVLSPVIAMAFVVAEALLTALAFRGASRLVRPGWHGDGGTAWALWFTGQLAEASRVALFPLYATVYTRAWLRLHGLHVGRRTEVSTAEGLSRLDALGEMSFVADHPMFASARAHRGWVHVAPVTVGDRTFVGNGALLGAGAVIGDDCLVGIESDAPRRAPEGTSWFGAPPLELPRVPDVPDPARTTDPPLRLMVARAAAEAGRILLPPSVGIVLGTLVLLALNTAGVGGGVPALVAAATVAVPAAAFCAVLVTVAVKWLVVGRYRSREAPLWSWFVWRDEIVNSCQEQLAGEWLLEKALGTPLVPAYLRAMGAKVGRDVWCETLAITEFDVVTIGDGCAVNRGACLETHLFHDRLLRIGPAELGAGSTLGPVSAVLPDSRLGRRCVVGGRSVVMRGEELPAGTRWHGSPVVRA
jgi:non-ribosomal peptide synthetase-like protein